MEAFHSQLGTSEIKLATIQLKTMAFQFKMHTLKKDQSKFSIKKLLIFKRKFTTVNPALEFLQISVKTILSLF